MKKGKGFRAGSVLGNVLGVFQLSIHFAAQNSNEFKQGQHPVQLTPRDSLLQSSSHMSRKAPKKMGLGCCSLLRNPVKALLVPITKSQMAELQALAEHGHSEEYYAPCGDFPQHTGVVKGQLIYKATVLVDHMTLSPNRMGLSIALFSSSLHILHTGLQ